MPNNKKKKSTSSAATKAAATANAASTRSPTNSTKDTSSNVTATSTSNNGGVLFTNGQLTMLVFLSIGITKLSEIRKLVYEQEATAAGEAEVAEGEEAIDPFKLCKSYFENDSICEAGDKEGDISLLSLLQFKYYTSLSLLFVVMSLVYHTWNTDTLLIQVNKTLTMFPIMLLSVAFYINRDELKYSRVQQNILMCITLITTQYALPSTTPNATTTNGAATTPSVSPITNFTSMNPYYTFRTLQGCCLVTLCITSFIEIYYNYINEEEGSSNTNTFTIENNQPLLHGWYIDQLSMAVMYLFVLLKFPNNQQRTFCLSISVMKFIEYYYLLPNMKLLLDLGGNGDGSTSTILEERLYHTTLGIAFFGFIAWFTPPLTWK